MGDWKPDENPYLVLGLTFESSRDDIKKVGCAGFAELSACSCSWQTPVSNHSLLEYLSTQYCAPAELQKAGT